MRLKYALDVDRLHRKQIIFKHDNNYIHVV